MVLPLAADMFGQRGRELADCAEGGADAGDDCPSDRDGDERAEEAGLEQQPNGQWRWRAVVDGVAAAGRSPMSLAAGQGC